MAKITRVAQKIFGSAAGGNEIAQFGSLANGTPNFTTNPTTIQALTEYLGGWFDAILGPNNPAIEDMNALFYLYAYQLAYILQAGVGEWDSATTYYIGSFASDGVGGIFASIQDTNLNHALTDTTWWLRANGSNTVSINPATQSPYVLAAADNGKTFNVNTANGAQTFTLPVPSASYRFTVKDSVGSCSTLNITIAQHASESIEGLAASFVCKADYGAWTFWSDGTNWFFS